MGIDPNWAKDPKIAYETINAWAEEESSWGKIPYLLMAFGEVQIVC